MTYAYVRARALAVAPASQWMDVDLSNMLVYQIFAKYREIILTLSADGEEVYVDFNQLRNSHASYNNTLLILLISIGDLGLDTLTEIPGGRIDYIDYTDAVRVGYSITRTKRGIQLPENYPKEDMEDLLLRRTKYPTEHSLIHSHCMVSVNGLFHQTDTDGEQAFIVDGGKSVQKRNMGHVGITSFFKIGQLTKLPINIADVTGIPGGEGLKDGIRFTIPQDIEGRSFMLCLGGYLVLPQEGVFWQSGTQEFRLALDRIPYLERLLESKDFIDLSGLELTESELNPTSVNMEQVFSDTVIQKYLQLSQTFFVIIDRKDVFWNKHYLRQSIMPGLFTAYQDPMYPLFVGHGRTAEYWKVFEDGHWSVNVIDAWRRNYMFNRQNQDTLVNVSDQLAMDRPYFDSQGLLLEIGAPAATTL